MVRNEILGILLRGLGMNQLMGTGLDRDYSEWQIWVRELKEVGIIQGGTGVVCTSRYWTSR